MDGVDAKPILLEVARALREVQLEAVLIGNAAAALRGAPVTTIDLDFVFRKTPRNLKKLRAFADHLAAVVLRPYYPASELYRVVRDDDGLQVDFMARIHGMRSYEGLRDRATPVQIAAEQVLVALLPDIIRSKRAADRPRDRAVLDVLQRAHEAQAATSKTGAHRAGKRK